MRQKCAFCIALLAIVLAAGCARKADDAALVTNIKSQMFSDAQLKDASLQVTSKNGQVTLAGTVSSDAARYEAYKIATQTAGVSKVNDQMSVQEAAKRAAPARDAQHRLRRLAKSTTAAHAQRAEERAARRKRSWSKRPQNVAPAGRPQQDISAASGPAASACTGSPQPRQRRTATSTATSAASASRSR